MCSLSLLFPTSPWYKADGTIMQSYVIGVAGGSASGKTSVAKCILKNLNVPWVTIVSMDSFYNVLTPEQSIQARENNFDFDHPRAFDYDLMFDSLCKLKDGKSVEIPIYNFATHAREDKTITVYGANVIIFEGIYALYDKRVRDLMDLKIFVDTDDDIRLARRLQRDIAERGRDLEGVLKQYMRFVKPAYDDHIQATVKYADVIIPRGLENVVAIDLITKHIRRQLNEKSLQIRPDLVNTPVEDVASENVIVLPPKNQILGIHTILRDKTTSRDDFIFYAERLSRLIIEAGLNLLPYDDLTVTTPVDGIYHGKELKKTEGKICGVSILRAGATMETGLRQVCNDVLIGKLLIQTDPNTSEPQLLYCKLPPDVKDHHVILMDATIGTGAAGFMAVRVLLDHDVPEDKIIFMTFLAAPVGLNAITRAFPRIKIVTSMIDPNLSKETFWIEPGIGNFGDRYFGTE